MYGDETHILRRVRQKFFKEVSADIYYFAKNREILENMYIKIVKNVPRILWSVFKCFFNVGHMIEANIMDTYVMKIRRIKNYKMSEGVLPFSH